MLSLGRLLAATPSFDSGQAEALADRLIQNVQATSADHPTRTAVLAPLINGGSVNFADPMVRERLPAVVASPGSFTTTLSGWRRC